MRLTVFRTMRPSASPGGSGGRAGFGTRPLHSFPGRTRSCVSGCVFFLLLWVGHHLKAQSSSYTPCLHFTCRKSHRQTCVQTSHAPDLRLPPAQASRPLRAGGTHRPVYLRWTQRCHRAPRFVMLGGSVAERKDLSLFFDFSSVL